MAVKLYPHTLKIVKMNLKKIATCCCHCSSHRYLLDYPNDLPQ